MVDHESRIKVNLGVYINIGTDSHPEDIPEDIMKDIIAQNLSSHLSEIASDFDSTFLAIDGYEVDEVKQFVDDVEVK